MEKLLPPLLATYVAKRERENSSLAMEIVMKREKEGEKGEEIGRRGGERFYGSEREKEWWGGRRNGGEISPSSYARTRACGREEGSEREERREGEIKKGSGGEISERFPRDGSNFRRQETRGEIRKTTTERERRERKRKMESERERERERETDRQRKRKRKREKERGIFLPPLLTTEFPSRERERGEEEKWKKRERRISREEREMQKINNEREKEKERKREREKEKIRNKYKFHFIIKENYILDKSKSLNAHKMLLNYEKSRISLKT